MVDKVSTSDMAADFLMEVLSSEKIRKANDRGTWGVSRRGGQLHKQFCEMHGEDGSAYWEDRTFRQGV